MFTAKKIERLKNAKYHKEEIKILKKKNEINKTEINRNQIRKWGKKIKIKKNDKENRETQEKSLKERANN